MPEAIEEVALAIRDTGAGVLLDLWHERDMKRGLSLGEWRDWMDDTIRGSSHILCLVSPHYLRLWEHKLEDAGGFGVAFESIRLIHALYLLRRRNDRRILTLRQEKHGFDCIPQDLVLGCAGYRWSVDRARLISHLTVADVPTSDRLSDGLFLDGLHYTDRSPETDSTESVPAKVASSKVADATAAEEDYEIAFSGIREEAVALEAQGVVILKTKRRILQSEIEDTYLRKSDVTPRFGGSGLWVSADEWRAPVGDFPPPWASAWGDDVYGLWADLTVNGATQRMRWIEPSGPEGFWMGSTQQERDEILDLTVRNWANAREQNPVRQVILRGFWLADTPCTQQFWQVVLGHNVSHFQGNADSLLRPVELIRREDIENFFVQLSMLLKLKTADLCLPTERQWEYAARAGTATAYWWGDKPDNSYANWDSEHQGTTPVKSFLPNHWGLFDMHGNVWERCENGWLQNLGQPDSQIDNSLCAVRGGSWLDKPASSRSAYRGWRPRRGSNLDLGFRFLLLSGSQSRAAVSAR
jgi:formylglycine-generating enzyme required for sulfatase activity